MRHPLNLFHKGRVKYTLLRKKRQNEVWKGRDFGLLPLFHQKYTILIMQEKIILMTEKKHMILSPN